MLQVQPDHGAVHRRSRQKGAAGNREQQPRRAVIPYGGADRPALAGARRGGDAFGGLLLHHDGQGGDGQGLLQQPHDDRRCDIVGEVGAYHHRHPGKMLLQQGGQLQLQHVAGHNGHIIEFRQRFRQNGRQAVVQLDGHHLFGPAGQLRGQHPKAGADLQYPHAGGGAAQLCHTGADGGVDDKILPQRAGKGKTVTAQQLFDDGRVGEGGHGSLLMGNKWRFQYIFFGGKKQPRPPAQRGIYYQYFTLSTEFSTHRGQYGRLFR